MADLTLVTPPPPSPAGLLPQPLPPLASPPPPQNKIRLTKRDSAVAALHRIGVSEEDIASRLRITTLAVQKSLNRWAQKQLQGSTELVQHRVNEMALANLELVNQLIRDGLTATKSVCDENGVEISREPDFAMRKSMAALLKDWTMAMIPKTPLISQQINQNNQQNNFNSVKGHNMEGRLRMIREKNGLKSDDDDVVDAEYEDVEVEGDELEEEVELDEVEDDAEDSSQGS
jgi:transposase